MEHYLEKPAYVPASAAQLVDMTSELLDAIAHGDMESVLELVAPGVDWHHTNATGRGGFTANGAGTLEQALRRGIPRRISIACLQAGRNYVVVEERLDGESGLQHRIGTYVFEGSRVVRAWVFDQ